jgi:hypothetical protein
VSFGIHVTTDPDVGFAIGVGWVKDDQAGLVVIFWRWNIHIGWRRT